MADQQSASVNGERKEPVTSSANGKTPAPSETATKTTPSTKSTETKQELSNAEKKKQQKAEKAAKRAKAKESQGPASGVAGEASGSIANATSQSRAPYEESKPVASVAGSKGPHPGQHKRTGSAGAASQSKSLPIRRRPSQSAPKERAQAFKQVGFLAHLYGQQRRRTLEGTSKDIHLAISSLALQQSNYIVCGSHARCVAMLLALKAVVKSYTTPHGTSLPRHLVSHHLSPQLVHLKSSRPFSISQANAIRWLKNIIATVDPSLAEDEAKAYIMESIDTFIREKFTVADQVIADTAAARITDGDVVAVFGKSAVVQSTLEKAIAKNVNFRVVVIDSRPLLEGKHLLRVLAPQVQVSYALVTGLAHAMEGVTKVFLGAHGLYSNGRLQSRAGTALLAMAAKARQIPVIVCAESIKLSDRIALDSIVGNELAPEEELLGEDIQDQPEADSPSTDSKTSDSRANNKGKQSSSGKDALGKSPQNTSNETKPGLVSKWLERDNLHLINTLYDITPAENIDMIITELGSFPSTSAPVVYRISAGP